MRVGVCWPSSLASPGLPFPSSGVPTVSACDLSLKLSGVGTTSAGNVGRLVSLLAESDNVSENSSGEVMY